MGVSVPRITARCTGCGACLLTCPERALRPRAGWAAGGTSPLYVLADRCTGCGDCAEVCPADAIEET
jgi:Pyruvate/2-oxoacid:ferredoxin oxidoreductase delta subunit